MIFNNNTFDKTVVIRKDGHIGVLTERELMRVKPSKNICTPVYRCGRVLFTLTHHELREIQTDYIRQCA